MPTEVERKFLVSEVPAEAAAARGADLRQGYLASEDDVEVRLRRSGEDAWLTVKAGAGLERVEVETGIGDAEAELLWPHTEGRRLEKTRFRIPLGAVVAELDVYGGALAGLRVVEVEFPSTADAAAFDPPAWFGRELTGEPGWSNAALARHGVPTTSA